MQQTYTYQQSKSDPCEFDSFFPSFMCFDFLNNRVSLRGTWNKLLLYPLTRQPMIKVLLHVFLLFHDFSIWFRINLRAILMCHLTVSMDKSNSFAISTGFKSSHKKRRQNNSQQWPERYRFEIWGITWREQKWNLKKGWRKRVPLTSFKIINDIRTKRMGVER